MTSSSFSTRLYGPPSWRSKARGGNAGGESGVACGRTVPTGRFPRHQPEVALEEGRSLLQPAGYGGAVDQGRQECGEVDQAVVPALQGQRGAVATVRPGRQPGQLPAATGAAQADPGLGADDAAGEADQDRGQGGCPRQVRHLPAGGSRRPAAVVRDASGADRPVAAGGSPWVRLAVTD